MSEPPAAMVARIERYLRLATVVERSIGDPDSDAAYAELAVGCARAAQGDGSASAPAVEDK